MTFEERVNAVAKEGYTERQARFLVTVMLHSGVCMVRQYCEFSGITRGQVSQDFFAELLNRNHASATTDVHSKMRIFHIFSRGLYEAIGEPNNRNRKPTALGAAVERLMLLDSVLASRDIEWLATEREKVAHFTRLFGTSMRHGEFPQLTFGSPPFTTTRFFPDKLPIGVPKEGPRVFTYLVKRSSPIEFRDFLSRHAELLRALPAWRLRLLVPAHFARATSSYEAAIREEMMTPLRLPAVDELRWYFEMKSSGLSIGAGERERFARAGRAFAAPRYLALYRRWIELGPTALDAVSSSSLADAIDRGIGEVEFQVLQHPYFHLRSFVGTA